MPIGADLSGQDSTSKTEAYPRPRLLIHLPPRSSLLFSVSHSGGPCCEAHAGHQDCAADAPGGRQSEMGAEVVLFVDLVTLHAPAYPVERGVAPGGFPLSACLAIPACPRQLT